MKLYPSMIWCLLLCAYVIVELILDYKNSLSIYAMYFCKQACFICKQKAYWRCTRCLVAAHTKCAPWPDKVIYPISQPGRAVCWRHPTDWRLEKKVNLSFLHQNCSIFLLWQFRIIRLLPNIANINYLLKSTHPILLVLSMNSIWTSQNFIFILNG